MSAKFMHVFTEENPELQKQIGCMTGIFQMFDRHHLLARRRLNGHSQKKLPSGHAPSNSSSVGARRNPYSPQIVLEKDISKRSYENKRVSMESSITSFSSSSCSSFSSLECSKSSQQELPSFDRPIVPEMSLKTSPKLKSSDPPNASAQSSRQSFDLRDVVKGSINRDTRGLSVKISTKDEAKNCVMRHRDSPRPTQLSNSMPVDLNESLRALAKLKESPWYFPEAGEPLRSPYEAKDSSFKPVSRETPRFSCDGREISRTSLDSREHNKPTSKHRELPRLSLDSRERSLGSSNFDSKPNSRYMNQDFTTSNPQQDLGSHKRSPSVVAKLMGLEALPMDLTKTYTNKDCDPFDAQENSYSMSHSSNAAAQDSKQDWLLSSPKNSLKGPVMPLRNKPDSVMKPVSNSKVSVETAPWRQTDRDRAPQKATFGYREAQLKQPPGFVYSEIEKRLKELEFRQSNKDLRALKQILDGMQAKGLLETEKSGQQHSKVSVSKNRSNQTPIGDEPNLKSANVRSQQIARPVPTLMNFESPIVIMKPAKSDRSGLSASSVIPLEGLSGLRKLRTNDPMDKKKSSINNKVAKDQTPKPSPRMLINRPDENISEKTRSRMVQGSSRPQQSSREDNRSSVKTTSSPSPRLQQRKLEMDRKPRPPLPSSESNKPQRPFGNRQPPESVSPRAKPRRKPTQVQENDGMLSERSETRNLSQQDEEVTLRSYSNISSASQVDVEVTSADRSADMNLAFIQHCSPSASGSADDNDISVSKQKKPSLSLHEDASTMELAAVAPEQPSPISVLDASLYKDDLQHSPVKRISDAFKDDEATRSSDDCWNLMDLADNLSPKVSSEINQKKLDSIENLVQNLRELSSSDDGPTTTTDHIASLCETQNSDHRYVSEILLASGILLKDLSGPMPIHLHPSGHPINPDLFLVLEQTNSGWLSKPETIRESTLRTQPDPKKLHRKLVFDVVNEILIQKLELTSQVPSINQFLRSRKRTARFLTGQCLLRALCSEIAQIQEESSRVGTVDDDNSTAGEDVLRRSEGWNDFGREVPGVVLEIERSIFKDLIDEVVSSADASVLKPKSSRRRRQLFAK